LTDDLESDGTPVISVKDYKMFFGTVLVNNVEKLSLIRKIKFDKKGVLATTDLQSEKFELTLNLIKSDSILENFNFNNLNNAFNSYLPLKKAKFEDVKKLLKYGLIPENYKFYSTLFSFDSNTKVSKTKNKIELSLENEIVFYCSCKSKCIRLCDCEKSGKNVMKTVNAIHLNVKTSLKFQNKFL
jgi:hypothetical protein